MEHYLEAIRRQARIERAHEALLKLPLLVALLLLWLVETVLLCLCAATIYLCWLLIASRSLSSENPVGYQFCDRSVAHTPFRTVSLGDPVNRGALLPSFR